MPPILVPFVKYFDFQGRANRAEYWQFMALRIGVGVVLAVGHLNVPGLVWWLATLIPQAAVGVRRYHDINRTGWWYLLPLGVLAIGLAIAFSMSADAVLALIAGAERGSEVSPYEIAHQLIVVGGVILVVLCLWVLSLLLPLVMHLQAGTPGSNRFGSSPNGDGVERIASVFDAPDETFEPAALPAPEPYKPVFDFGPSPADRSPPPAAARGMPDVPVMRPAAQAPRPMASPAANGPRPFGKRGL